MKTLIIGLGNPILTDDGVGIYVLREVQRKLPPDSGIDVLELAVGGITLMEAMIGYERVILIDALMLANVPVGEIVLFNAGDLPETLNSASAHDSDLPTSLQMGRDLGAELPNQDQIQIVGIQAAEVLTFCEKPTSAVAAAIPQATATVLNLLGCAYEVNS